MPIMTEKVFPFFESGLKDILSRLEVLEKLNERALKELAMKKAKVAEDTREREEKAAKKAVVENKARLKEERKKRQEKEEALALKKADIKAKLEIDDSGRAKVVKKKNNNK